MKHTILIAGAAALAFAAPAMAKPGHGHGKGHKHAPAQISPFGHVEGHCPPGLAKKTARCIPPGQAKKYGLGQRLPLGFGSPFAYNQIPYDLRTQYGLNPQGNYYYGDGYLYRVDPKTMLIQQAIAALLR